MLAKEPEVYSSDLLTSAYENRLPLTFVSDELHSFLNKMPKNKIVVLTRSGDWVAVSTKDKLKLNNTYRLHRKYDPNKANEVEARLRWYLLPTRSTLYVDVTLVNFSKGHTSSDLTVHTSLKQSYSAYEFYRKYRIVSFMSQEIDPVLKLPVSVLLRRVMPW